MLNPQMAAIGFWEGDMRDHKVRLTDYFVVNHSGGGNGGIDAQGRRGEVGGECGRRRRGVFMKGRGSGGGGGSGQSKRGPEGKPTKDGGKHFGGVVVKSEEGWWRGRRG